MCVEKFNTFRFNQQNKEVRFGSYVFGPVIMRMYYFLNKPDEALKVSPGQVSSRHRAFSFYSSYSSHFWFYTQFFMQAQTEMEESHAPPNSQSIKLGSHIMHKFASQLQCSLCQFSLSFQFYTFFLYVLSCKWTRSGLQNFWIPFIIFGIITFDKEYTIFCFIILTQVC